MSASSSECPFGYANIEGIQSTLGGRIEKKPEDYCGSLTRKQNFLPLLIYKNQNTK